VEIVEWQYIVVQSQAKVLNFKIVVCGSTTSFGNDVDAGNIPEGHICYGEICAFCTGIVWEFLYESAWDR
jgi:hypothetical protein